MSERAARALSLAVVGGIAAIVFPLLGLQFWVGFIAWGWYIQAGGNSEALMKTGASLIWGAVLAGLALTIAIGTRNVIGPWMVRSFIAVAVTAILLVMSSGVAWLSLVPAAICGYAAVLGLVLQDVEMRTIERLMHPGRTNGLVTAILSMILGLIFGVITEKAAAALKKS